MPSWPTGAATQEAKDLDDGHQATSLAAYEILLNAIS